MKIIWSSDKLEHKGYICVPTLAQLTPMLAQPLEELVYHKSEDSIEDISRVLLNTKIAKLYYINDTPNEDMTALVIGKGGKVIDDEFYLLNPELMETVESDSTGSELALMDDIGDMSIIRGFQDRIKSGDTNYSKKYMELVVSSAGQLTKDIREANVKRRQTAEAGVRVLGKVARQLEGINAAHQKERIKILAQIDSIAAPVVEHSMSATNQSVFVFPEQKYRKTVKGIVVKEIGNVPYLTSFMMGLLDYAIRKQHKRARLTIILPPGENYEYMYPSAHEVGQTFVNYTNETQSINYSKNITVAFTNYPTVTVMNKLVTRNPNLNIILDRRQSSPKPFYLPSEKFPLETFYAVQSASMFQAFKGSGNTMKPSNSFSSIQELMGTMFTIPMFESYSKNKQQRIVTYEQECSEFYKRLIGE